ncbi:DUF222 domain-containing protein [Microbispora bryophytorum]|uniref:DUF222 domain-containing protein n=1 Tax=Microbispora bryophytorum TaxID=1460882 RepID=A0A8H9GWR1_9ACTN|nr:DUF222 domain-containing protein [Microbispora bryophytorum]MBD3137178.1 DUF222 domain-containing protein [Microbispora bryophytorum]GGO07291.1 hypothetical protein GCM10011574_20650 [Microbispora bryophytorum]
MDLFNLDPDRPRRTNKADDGWWDRLIADSPLWSFNSSLARDKYSFGPFPLEPEKRDSGGRGNGPRNGDTTHGQNDGTTDDCAANAGPGGAGPGGAERARSSWVLVGSLREPAQALALAALPGDADICVVEAEDLLFARDRITCALADRVGKVHRAGQARQHGHASTRSWLRTAAGMSVAGAGRLLTLAVELARLPKVREKFAAGVLSAGVVEAICTATARLSDEHAGLAEPILLELAGKAGPAEVAKAGRYLRAVLDPDGEERDERADYGRRFLRVRPTAGGGLEGEFYLPREAAARLRALLDAYAKPRAEGDDRPLRVRQADAFIALMEQKIVAELLVLVNAESLPTDPQPDHPEDPAPEPGPGPGPDHPEDIEDAQDAENAEDVQGQDRAEDTEGGENAEEAEDADAQGAEDTEDGRDAQGAHRAEGGRDGENAENGEGVQGAGDGRDAQDAEGADSEDGWGSEDTGAFGDAGSVDGPCPVEDSDVEDAIPTDADPGNLSDDDPGDAHPSDVGDAGMTGAATPARGEGHYQPRDPDTAEAATAATPAADAEAAAGPAADANADAAADTAAGSTDLDLAATAPCEKESRDPEVDEQEACEHEADEHRTREHGACERGTSEHEAGGRGVREQRAGDHDTANAAPAEGGGAGDASTASAESDNTAPTKDRARDRGAAHTGTMRARTAWPTYGGSAPPHAAPPSAAQSHAAQWPDPPPEDAAAHHTHAGHQPAGDCRHAQGTPECHNDVHNEQSAAGTGQGAAPGAPELGRQPQAEPGRPSESEPGTAPGASWPEPGTPPGEPGPGTPPGTAPRTPPGRPAGTASETLLGAVPGALWGAAPGLLLATGQMLPVSSVHRLARTSALVRLVMDAEGQVLDMGRKVRLATPAQRRARLRPLRHLLDRRLPAARHHVPDRPRRQLEHRRPDRPETPRPGLPVPQPRPLPAPRPLHPPQDRHRPLDLHLPPGPHEEAAS